MFRAFQYNDDLTQFFISTKDYYVLKGTQNYNQQQSEIKSNLNEYYLKSGSLDGSKLKNSWFPSIDAHVFLSHSNKDKDDILALAGFLYEEFNIKCFIDSNVWGYANDLLKEIDDKYCRNQNSNTYNYDARNFSTSHIHMMLNTALMEMIDKTECVIFVGTPNSLEKVEDTIKKGTYSPWIYSELNMIRFLRTRLPERTLTTYAKYSKEERSKIILEGLRINHDVTTALESLDPMTNNHLLNLLKTKIFISELSSPIEVAEQTLDRLYKMVKGRSLINEQ